MYENIPVKKVISAIISNCCVVCFQDCLQPLSMQALPAPAESLCIVEMGGSEGEEGEKRTRGGLFLNIGLQVRTIGISRG